MIPRSGPPIADAGDRGGQEGSDTVGQAPLPREHDSCPTSLRRVGAGKTARVGFVAAATPGLCMGPSDGTGCVRQAPPPDGERRPELAPHRHSHRVGSGWSGVGETTAPLGGASGRRIDWPGAARAPPAAARPQRTMSVPTTQTPAGRRIHFDLGSIPLPILSWAFTIGTLGRRVNRHRVAMVRPRDIGDRTIARCATSLCWPLRTGVPQRVLPPPGGSPRAARRPGSHRLQRSDRWTAWWRSDSARARLHRRCWTGGRCPTPMRGPCARARSRSRSRRRRWSTSRCSMDDSCAARPRANAPC